MPGATPRTRSKPAKTGALAWRGGLCGLVFLAGWSSAVAQSSADAGQVLTAIAAEPLSWSVALEAPLAGPTLEPGYKTAALDFAALLASLSGPAEAPPALPQGAGLQKGAARSPVPVLPADLRYVSEQNPIWPALAALSPNVPLATGGLGSGTLTSLPQALQKSLEDRLALPGRRQVLERALVGPAGDLLANLEHSHRLGAQDPRLATLAVRLNLQEKQLDRAHQTMARLSLDGQGIRRQLAASEGERRVLAERLQQKQARIDLELLPELRATRDGLLRLGQDHSALLASQEQLKQELAAAQHRITRELEPKIDTLLKREGTQVSALFDDLDLLRFERDSAMLRAQVVDQAYQQVTHQFDQDLRPKIIALQGQLASLSGERDQLSTQVQSLNEEIEARYQPMLQDLKHENIDLQNRNTKLANHIEQLERRLKTSEARAVAVQGRVDPQACERFVDQQADMFAAMGSLQQLFQLDQVTPKDLRPIDDTEAGAQAVTAFDLVFNDLIAGWLLERRIDPFASPDQHKLALLKGANKKKARWTPESSDQVLALQAASNAWLKARGLRLSTLGIPAAKGCNGRLCLTGLVDRRTRMVAGYIFDRDPSVFPGGAPALSQSQGGEDVAARVRQRRRSAERLGGDVVSKLRRACRGQS